jgi:GNAT superfamily N-acetyltransferase
VRVEIDVVTGQQWPEAVGRLLRELPEWFGIEASVLNYIEAARTCSTVAALRDDVVVGVCLVQRHTSVAAEIELLAVRRSLHRHGIGRRLVESVETELAHEGVELLQVKTFGPSGTSEEYGRARSMHRSGFCPSRSVPTSGVPTIPA